MNARENFSSDSRQAGSSDGLENQERRRFLAVPSVYVIATSERSVRPLDEQLRLLVEGGVGAVQLREKGMSDEELVALACRIAPITRWARIPLILNDRPALVRHTCASGVHVGVEDPSVAEARRALGPNAIVGATVHSLDEALAAEREGADYLGVGPIHSSRTKPGRPGQGLEWLAVIVRSVRIPCYAIGGIRVEHIPAVLASGARGVAVCDALLSARDATVAARSMRDALGRAVSP